MYTTDNGIRKRISPVPVNQISSVRDSKITLNQPQDELRPLPMIFNFKSEIDLKKVNNHEIMILEIINFIKLLILRLS